MNAGKTFGQCAGGSDADAEVFSGGGRGGFIPRGYTVDRPGKAEITCTGKACGNNVTLSRKVYMVSAYTGITVQNMKGGINHVNFILK